MPYYGKQSLITCLGCNVSIHLILDNWNRRWDWNRGLCDECSELIPKHIPKKQYNWYKIMHTKLSRGEDYDADSYMPEMQR